MIFSFPFVSNFLINIFFFIIRSNRAAHLFFCYVRRRLRDRRHLRYRLTLNCGSHARKFIFRHCLLDDEFFFFSISSLPFILSVCVCARSIRNDSALHRQPIECSPNRATEKKKKKTNAIASESIAHLAATTMRPIMCGAHFFAGFNTFMRDTRPSEWDSVPSIASVSVRVCSVLQTKHAVSNGGPIKTSFSVSKRLPGCSGCLW